MAEPKLAVNGLMKSFGALRVTDDLAIDVIRGELHAIIGPNGAGKTTLLNQLSGELAPDAGTIHFDGRDITRLPAYKRARLGIARSFQISTLFADFSAEDNVALAVQAREPHSFRFWHAARGDAGLRGPARTALEQVGLGARGDQIVANLSHGEHRQLELAMALATEPTLLLLDEPMAGMGTEDCRKMVDLLTAIKRRVTVVLVEHDMDVVAALADRVTVLDGGKPIASGPYAQIRTDPAVRTAYLGEHG